mgnify:CR=1 FL=1
MNLFTVCSQIIGGNHTKGLYSGYHAVLIDEKIRCMVWCGIPDRSIERLTTGEPKHGRNLVGKEAKIFRTGCGIHHLQIPARSFQ